MEAGEMKQELPSAFCVKTFLALNRLGGKMDLAAISYKMHFLALEKVKKGTWCAWKLKRGAKLRQAICISIKCIEEKEKKADILLKK